MKALLLEFSKTFQNLDIKISYDQLLGRAETTKLASSQQNIMVVSQGSLVIIFLRETIDDLSGSLGPTFPTQTASHLIDADFGWLFLLLSIRVPGYLHGSSTDGFQIRPGMNRMNP